METAMAITHMEPKVIGSLKTHCDGKILDGVADEDDAFPNERSQSEDMDGDGYGDNPDGENPDAFPSNPDEWQDTDGNFVGNNEEHSHLTLQTIRF